MLCKIGAVISFFFSSEVKFQWIGESLLHSDSNAYQSSAHIIAQLPVIYLSLSTNKG